METLLHNFREYFSRKNWNSPFIFLKRYFNYQPPKAQLSQPRNAFLLALAMLVVMASCQSPVKQLSRGNYDRAVELATKKMRKGKLKDKHLLALEQAFNVAQQRDLDRIQYLKIEGNPDNWLGIFDHYAQIRERQNLVKPWLPVYIASEERQADIKLIAVDREMAKAKENAAAYLYEKAGQLLATGQRHDARQAYSDLLVVKSLIPNFRDVDARIEEARYLGTNRVLLQVRNSSATPLAPEMEDELKKINLARLNEQWTAYFTRPDSGKAYDFTIFINLQAQQVSPEQVKEREYLKQAEIEDGWKYLLDEHDEFVKDSSGNKIKVPVYKTVGCQVKETHQRKSAHLTGTIDFFDNRAKQLVQSVPFSETVVFEHSSALANGDLRALPEPTLALLDHRPVPFPTAGSLLLQAAGRLRMNVEHIVHDHAGLVRQ